MCSVKPMHDATSNTAVTDRHNIKIIECKPVWLNPSTVGFHVRGTFHDGISPLPPESFLLATDDEGKPMLKRWWPSHVAWHVDDRKAILDAIEQAIAA